MSDDDAAAPGSASALRRAAAFVREALGSHDRDFTEGSIPRAVALLAVPMVLEPLMEGLFAVADVYFVGRLGSEAIAAIGLTEALVVLVYTVGFGLGFPVTAVVSRRIGERSRDGAAVAAVQASGLALLASLPIAVAGVLFGGQALELMGAEPEVARVGAAYAAITLASSPLITLLFVNAAVFRGSGDAVVPLRALWLANGVNIVLDPCLIFGLGPFPELGLTGAAVASVVGRCLGVVYLYARLFRGTPRFRVERRHLRLDLPVVGELVRLSVGGIGQLLVETTSWVFLARIVALSGSVAVAGYTVAIRVLVFTLMPAWGLSGAAATLVGQNLGARKPDRAMRSLWLVGTANMLFLGVVAVVCVVAPGPMTAPFTEDPAVREVAAMGLRIGAYGYVFYAWGMVLTQAFNGAGDTRTPMIINLLSFWIFKLPLAYVLSTSVEGMSGARGVFVAIFVAYSLNAVLAFAWLRTGRWRMSVV